ncbi:hypothetical protein G7Y89_g9020 [Cudoniella acicularis]|uniref:Uncharacterized protein n=1 Tax=Cudoniella acicularis TaxID=354080 RepID=A0A8H4RFH0_9HELO|nr:hypothetical protein G7Y89_g9020 [Cudoniella acicularis]
MSRLVSRTIFPSSATAAARACEAEDMEISYLMWMGMASASDRTPESNLPHGYRDPTPQSGPQETLEVDIQPNRTRKQPDDAAQHSFVRLAGSLQTFLVLNLLVTMRMRPGINSVRTTT